MKARGKFCSVTCKGEKINYIQIKQGNYILAELWQPSEILGHKDFRLELPKRGITITGIQSVDELERKARQLVGEFFGVTDILPDKQGYPFELLCVFLDPLLDDVK